MSDFAITTDGLTKVYSGRAVLDGLALRVPCGAVYGFLGRNGAGKTTTIRMLLGLAQPTAGTISVLGRHPIRERIPVLERTAYVPERKVLFDTYTAAQLVDFNRGFYPGWSDELAQKYVARLEIPIKTPFVRLSSGDKTKVYLLLALAQRADLVILDEPTSGLDPIITDQLLKILIEDYASEGRTVFLSSHQLTEIERIADWVGILDSGKLLMEAKLEDVRGNYRRVTASGAPAFTAPDNRILSATLDSGVTEYIVRSEAEAFIAESQSQGARVVDVSPLSLNELFLHLCRTEKSCIS